MWLYGIYLALKVVPMSLLFDPSMYYIGTWGKLGKGFWCFKKGSRSLVRDPYKAGLELQVGGCAAKAYRLLSIQNYMPIKRLASILQKSGVYMPCGVRLYSARHTLRASLLV